jgi:photosystem II stability/assembly factor-like uncharacterized protein
MSTIRLLLSLFLLAEHADRASAQWVRTSEAGIYSCSSMTVVGQNIYVGARNGIFRSSDGGVHWDQLNSGLSFGPQGDLVAFAVDAATIFVGGLDAGVYRMTDGGSTWIPVNTTLTNRWVQALVLNRIEGVGTELCAGTAGGGVFRSTNGGGLWIHLSDSGLTNKSVQALAASDTNLFAGTSTGIFLFSRGSSRWTQVDSNLTNPNTTSLLLSPVGEALGGTDPMFLFAGTFGGGVFWSADQGATWNPGSPGNLYVTSLLLHERNLFAGAASGVHLSTDRGRTWVNTGLQNNYVRSVCVSGSYVYAGTSLNDVWRRPLSEITTSVRAPDEMPDQFTLFQNYPNPFNPNTTIKFGLPKSSDVRLSVFDMLGREVSALVNERRTAGVHEVRFDASGLSSGVYFYRLQAGSFVETKKLLLLR